jgi:hypothetical protein
MAAREHGGQVALPPYAPSRAAPQDAGYPPHEPGLSSKRGPYRRTGAPDLNLKPKESIMHAVVIRVTINDHEAATKALEERVVPLVSGSPGFVAGYWVDLSDNRGASVAVFESEGAAQAIAGAIQAPGDYVTFNSVEVGEVVANA